MPALVNARLLELRDGRILAFCDWGDPAAAPAIFLHGAPGSRLFRPPDEKILIDAGVHLITVDRPGFGLSDFQPRRQLMDWPRDILELADALQLRRFAIAGFSAGAPHALACAALLPDRITRVAIISGNAPNDRPGAFDDVPPDNQRLHHQLRTSPESVKNALSQMIAGARACAQDLVDDYCAGAPPADQVVLGEPAARSIVAESYREAARRGARGFIAEFALLARSWRIPLQRVTSPVDLWYGADDRACPPQMGRYLQSQLAQAALNILPDEGHFSTVFRHWGQILSNLVQERHGSARR